MAYDRKWLYVEVFEGEEQYSGFLLKGIGGVMPEKILQMSLHPCSMDDFRMRTYMN